MEGASISVRNLSKCYALYRHPLDRLKEALHPFRKRYHAPFHALDGVSFEIKRGESLGIVGANGSGKSTLLKLLAGVLLPTSGEVLVSGRVTALLELGVGFNPELSGRENIYLSGTIMGLRRSEIEALEDDILGFADIGEFIEQPLKTYSSGMYVRLAFSVATAVKPEVLIVDEALSVGDVAFQARCAQRMRKLIDDFGCTTILVSHDLTAVKALCEHTLYLVRGKVVQLGPSGEVCDRYVHDQFKKTGFFSVEDSVGGFRDANQEALLPHAEILTPEVLSSFEERVRHFRQHSGGAKILLARLMACGMPALSEVSFGTTVTLQLFIRALQSFDELVVAFYVKDLNQLEILGSNNRYEGQPIRNVQTGDVVCVEFELTNHLKAGGYSIQVIVADSLPTNSYFDWIENAVVFTSEVPPNSTRWALVNPPMACRVRHVGGGEKLDSSEAA